MDLGAEMAVLSACNTGLGKTRIGEGVMSLARAFLYAGCPSVVMSHWSVDDQATSKLIAIFYEYLADGTTKDQALRNAKLAYLREANGPDAHPFYWGAFVLNGDPDPLNRDRSLTWIFAFVRVAAILLFFFIRTCRS